MDRLKRKLGFYIMAGMIMLSTVLGIGLLSRSGDFSSSQTSVAESVDDDSSNENGEDKEISAQAVTTLTGQTYTSSYTVTGDTIFDNCYFTANVTFSSDISYNITFRDCYFEKCLFFGSATYSGEMTFSNCIFEKSGYGALISVQYLTGATINYRDCWVYDTASSTGNYSYVSTSASTSGLTVNIENLWGTRAFSTSLETTVNGAGKQATNSTITSSTGYSYPYSLYDVDFWTSSINYYETTTSAPIWSGSWDFENKWGFYVENIDTATTNAATPKPLAYLETLWNDSANATRRIRMHNGSQSIRTYASDSAILNSLTGVHFSQVGKRQKWATSNGGEGSYTVTVSKNGDLYAVWENEIYKVTLDSARYSSSDSTTPSSSATTAASPSTVYAYYDTGWYKNVNESTSPWKIDGATKITSITKPTMTGYTFGGFYPGKAGAGSATPYIKADGSFNSNKPTNITMATTLYAKWTANTYTIKFNGNGSTGGSMSNLSMTYDVSKNLTTNAFSKTGYTFAGWATSSTGSVVYSNGQSVSNLSSTNGAVVNLYAKWTAKRYSVTFNSNGGTYSSTPATAWALYDSKNYYTTETGSTAYTFVAPTRAGYTFKGYADSSTATTANYIEYSGSAFTVAKNWDKSATTTTLYAVWSGNSYTITVNNNGGSGGAVNSTSYTTKAASQNFSLTLPTRTGYSFTGWSITGNTGTAAVSSDNKTLTIAANTYGNITVTAQWSANIYTITLDSKYYATSSTTTGTAVTDVGTAAIYEKYATGFYTTSACTTTIATISKPTYTGYTFGGYYTGKAGSGTQVIDSTGKITAANTKWSSNTTIYAKWTTNSYTITLAGAGGTISSLAVHSNSSGLSITTANSKMTATYNQTGRFTATLARTGYTFNGWTNSGSGTVTNNNALPTNSTDTSVKNLATSGNVTLTAKWLGNKYKITLDAITNGGSLKTGTASTVYARYGSTTIFKSSTITDNNTATTQVNDRAGHTFLGWYSSASGDGSLVIKTDGTLASAWASTSEITVYARWSVNTMTLTVKYHNATVTNATGLNVTADNCTVGTTDAIASGSTTTVKHAYTTVAQSVKLARANASYSYYISVGTAPTTASSVNSFTYSWTPTSNTTIDVYIYQRYTIIYNGNNFTGGTVPATGYKIHGTNYTVATNNLTRTGYTASGWNTSADGSGTPYEDGDVYKTNANLTLFAKWNINTYTLTVRYKDFKGSNAVTMAVAATGNTIAGSPVTFVTGGTASATVKHIYTTVAQTVTISVNAATGKYYYIKADAAAGVGSSVNSITYSWTPNANKTIDIYVCQRYTVSYNGNGASSGSTGATYKAHGTNVNLSANGFVKTGHTFQGWSTSSSSSTIAYENGDTYSANSDATLYAVWKINTYTAKIKYVAYRGIKTGSSIPTMSAGGSGVTSVSNVVVGAAAEFTATYGTNCLLLASVSGQTDSYNNFAINWSDAPGGIGTTNGKSWDAKSNVEFSVYIYDAYSVRYNANGGSINPASSLINTPQVRFYNGAALTLYTMVQNGSEASTTISRTGYTFSGWNTEANGSGTDYACGASYKENKGRMLYAKWINNPYIITYKANGGSGSDKTQSVTYNQSFTTKAKDTFERTGYTFQGWSTSASSLAGDYQSANHAYTYTTVGNTTLYAYWKVNSYTITLDANGGSVATKTYYVYYDNNKIYSTNTNGVLSGEVAVNAAIWDLHTFTGWTAEANTGNPIINTDGALVASQSGYTDASSNWKHASDATLYAKWSNNAFRIQAFSGVTDSSLRVTSLGSWVAGTAPALAQKDLYYGNTYGVLPTLTRNGYTFKGWADSKGASTANITSETVLQSSSAKQEIYAVWSNPIGYTITYVDYAGKTTTQSYNITSTGVVKTPTRTGYSFAGYTPSQTANGATIGNWTGTIAAGASLTGKYGDVTLTENWSVLRYEVTFNANNGSFDPAPAKAYAQYASKNYYTSSTGTTAYTFSVPTRNGFTFLGYTNKQVADSNSNTTANASYITYSNGTFTVAKNWDIAAATTLYAVWKNNIVKITLDPMVERQEQQHSIMFIMLINSIQIAHAQQPLQA